MFFLPMLMSAVAGGVSMYSQYQAGKAQEAQAKYNAIIAKQDAEAQARAIDAEALHRGEEARAELASLRARGAGSNVDYESGSPLLIATKVAKQNALDMMELNRQAEIARTRGQAEADMYRYQGKQARRASFLSMGGTALSTAGSMAGTYAQGQYLQGLQSAGTAGATTAAGASTSLLSNPFASPAPLAIVSGSGTFG